MVRKQKIPNRLAQFQTITGTYYLDLVWASECITNSRSKTVSIAELYCSYVDWIFCFRDSSCLSNMSWAVSCLSWNKIFISSAKTHFSIESRSLNHTINVLLLTCYNIWMDINSISHEREIKIALMCVPCRGRAASRRNRVFPQRFCVWGRRRSLPTAACVRHDASTAPWRWPRTALTHWSRLVHNPPKNDLRPSGFCQMSMVDELTI